MQKEEILKILDELYIQLEFATNENNQELIEEIQDKIEEYEEML